MLVWLDPVPAKMRAESCVVLFWEKQLFALYGSSEEEGGATVAGGMAQQPFASCGLLGKVAEVGQAPALVEGSE
jgi:hypothetical protein